MEHRVCLWSQAKEGARGHAKSHQGPLAVESMRGWQQRWQLPASIGADRLFSEVSSERALACLFKRTLETGRI